SASLRPSPVLSAARGTPAPGPERYAASARGRHEAEVVVGVLTGRRMQLSGEMRIVLARDEPARRAPGRVLGRMLGGAALIAVLTAVAVSTAGFEAGGTGADLFAQGGLITSPDLTPTGGGSPTTG